MILIVLKTGIFNNFRHLNILLALRHAELVSASHFAVEGEIYTLQKTLKKVQGDVKKID